MLPKKKLEKLYKSGLSMREISEEKDWSYYKVRYWMEEHDISKRSRSEASYAKHNPEGDPFNIKDIESKEEQQLFSLAIGLYLGEGEKTGPYSVRLGNTDPALLNIFLRFLRNICRVKEDKIMAELNIFDDVDTEKVVKFWLDKLNLERSQLRTIVEREHHKKGNYNERSKYGTLMIFVSNTKLKSIVMKWCKEYKSRYK